MGRIYLDDVADDQPIEQHAQRRQVLLNRGRRELSFQLFEESRDMGGFDRAASSSMRLAPLGEAPGGVHVRLARVVVVELGGEEFEEAPGGLRRRCKEGKGNTGRGGGGDQLLGHDLGSGGLCI